MHKNLMDFAPENTTLDKKRFKQYIEVPSAHEDGKVFTVYKNEKGHWVCSSENGPCEHYRRWHTPCRHILQAKYDNIKEMFDDIHRLAELRREGRFNDTFDDVITYMMNFKSAEFCELCTLFMHIAIRNGKADSDDLQDATGEVYEIYKVLCKKTRADSLTQRRVADLISELDMLGIITARVISKGRYGRTRDIKISSSPEDIMTLLQEDEVFKELANYKIRGQTRLL